MSVLLKREGSPLTEAQWRQIDDAMITTARRALVGRQFIPLSGPYGLGTQVLPHDTVPSAATVNQVEGEPFRVTSRVYREVPVIARDFEIDARDLETAAQYSMPIDPGAAAAASLSCALAEDQMIFHGLPDKGLPGLLTAEGRQQMELSAWDKPGTAFADVMKGIEALKAAGHVGPYALVVGPGRWAPMHRVLENSGILEIEQIRKVVTDGVFQSPVLASGQAVLVATGVHNMDLAVAQDLVALYLETSRLVHSFRVMASLALRIKNPGAILVLG